MPGIANPSRVARVDLKKMRDAISVISSLYIDKAITLEVFGSFESQLHRWRVIFESLMKPLLTAANKRNRMTSFANHID